MAYESKIGTDDLFGRFFICVKDRPNYVSYYETINEITPLLESDDFTQSLSGYYINGYEYKAVRLSYFVRDMQKNELASTVKDFVNRSNLLRITKEEPPHDQKVSEGYGGVQYELRFRKYLNLISRIALDLLIAKPENAKSLALTYRWQVFPVNSPVEYHFEGSFNKYSETYRSLSESQINQLWQDLALWPSQGNFDWAHFFINPVLAFDRPDLHEIKSGGNKTISEINEKIPEDYNFRIPEDRVANK